MRRVRAYVDERRNCEDIAMALLAANRSLAIAHAAARRVRLTAAGGADDDDDDERGGGARALAAARQLRASSSSSSLPRRSVASSSHLVAATAPPASAIFIDGARVTHLEKQEEKQKAPEERSAQIHSEVLRARSRSRRDGVVHNPGVGGASRPHHEASLATRARDDKLTTHTTPRSDHRSIGSVGA